MITIINFKKTCLILLPVFIRKPYGCTFYFEISPNIFLLNKRHWNTITLGGDVPEDELLHMIERSYDLTKKSVRAGSDEEDG
ncbi:MAG: MmcQ/YjbR family DNA-binding protein [Oscillospiraceae bacterium]|nr:MmcQ/YjbR family DNA-binding protein [Oscillospiraceae bacterium]